MRNHKGVGKGGKRKAETNFVEAYSGASELAPPPASRDVLAVPAKLRKIMQLKSLITGGAPNGPHGDPRGGKDGNKSSKVAKKYPLSKSSEGIKVGGTQVASHEKGTKYNTGILDEPVGKRKGSFASKWKKGEEELKKLVEKMDKRVKTGISAGVGERRKSYLNEKKRKRKGKGKNLLDLIPDLNQYDRVEFGETVQAPPKLSFPERATYIKEKERLQSGKVSSMRLRQEAIDAYRQRKEWSARPGGQQLPVLNLTDAEI